MMEFLTGLENSGVGTWVRESPSVFGYTGLITLHAIGLAFAVGLSWAISLRVLGVAPRIPLAALEPVFTVIVMGFWLCAISGVLLAIGAATRDLPSPIFQTKMAFVVLGAVSVRLLKNRVFSNQPALTEGVVPPMGRILAGVTMAVWMAAMVAGRLNEYPKLLGYSYH